jgi:hypothetical protein
MLGHGSNRVKGERYFKAAHAPYIFLDRKKCNLLAHLIRIIKHFRGAEIHFLYKVGI